MKPTERDIHLKMIDTLCNMLSAARIQFLELASKDGAAHIVEQQNPDAIEAEVREIAERELKEKP